MFVLLFWICFGALMGWIVGLVQGKQERRAIIKCAMLGVLGGIIGGWGSNAIVSISGNSYSNDLTSMMFAIVGAVIIVIFLAGVSSRHPQ